MSGDLFTGRVFPGDQPQSAGAFRRFVVAALTGLPPEVVEDGRLVASELAANAGEHTRSGLAGGAFLGRVEIGVDAVLIEVVDQGSDTEAPEVLDLAEAEHGRGLAICCALGELHTDTTPGGGRRVAVRLPLPPSAPEEVRDDPA